jgi:hypothetical protein
VMVHLAAAFVDIAVSHTAVMHDGHVCSTPVGPECCWNGGAFSQLLLFAGQPQLGLIIWYSACAVWQWVTSSNQRAWIWLVQSVHAVHMVCLNQTFCSTYVVWRWHGADGTHWWYVGHVWSK